MKFSFPKAETSVILLVYIQHSTSGAGLGSLDQTSSITGGYVKRDGTGVALAVDEDVATEGLYQAPSTAAHVRIGTPANMPTGFYELHFHNTLFTTADYVTIGLEGAANMATLPLEIQLTTFNPADWAEAGRLDVILDATLAAAAAAPTVNEIADAFLKRGAANVDGSAEDDSPYSLIMAAFHSKRVGTAWTLYETDGETPHDVKTMTIAVGTGFITAVDD